jgi:toxin ParE1/3/4
MRLVWSAFAITDRDEIYEYIESESPRNAAMVDKRIAESVELLPDFPESGRAGRVAGTRECVVPRSPYIAAYTVTGDVIRILRILHGAQRWPDEFTGS